MFPGIVNDRPAHLPAPDAERNAIGIKAFRIGGLFANDDGNDFIVFVEFLVYRLCIIAPVQHNVSYLHLWEALAKLI